LEEVEKNGRLSEELNTLRFLNALLAISILFSLIMILRRRPFASLTSGGVDKGGEQRRLGKH